jgi:hypothetical protein
MGNEGETPVMESRIVLVFKKGGCPGFDRGDIGA